MNAEPLSARVLLACLHRHPEDTKIDLDTVDEVTWAEVVRLAAVQRVRPQLHQGLIASGRSRLVPPAAWNRLSSACQAVAFKNLAAYAQLSRLIGALQADNIPVLLLKGAHLAPEVYGNLALREMLDFDVMVPLARIADAVTIAQGLDFVAPRPISVELDTSLRAHVTALRHPTALLELHWNLNRPGQPYSVTPEPFWERAQPVASVPGALGLCPDDLLQHVCVHATLMHQCEAGIRPYLDIAVLIERDHDTLHWPTIVEAARQRGWSRGVALALMLAADLVGADVKHEHIASFGISDLTAAVPVARALAWTSLEETHQFTRGLSAVLSGRTWRERIDVVRARVIPAEGPLGRPTGVGPRLRFAAMQATELGKVLRKNAGAAVELAAGQSPRRSGLTNQRELLRRWLSASASQRD
ncbi:MAG: nucleotidyltransferase family protein [Acidobacteria bacterium]|nr:nucleotidyltransferase family protein [Acidobacteriota bacterium]